MSIAMELLSVIAFALSITSASADYKSACEGKVADDKCEYVTDKETQCSMKAMPDGEQGKFCKVADSPGAKTYSECSIHSRQGYLACFSKKEDAPVFQACVGRTRGQPCQYETPESSRGGKTTPAFITTAHCIAHYDHKILMCLEALGQEDDGECAGKGVGAPCKNEDSDNAVCAHHSRRGSWMCLNPKEENMVFVVCQGAKTNQDCDYTSSGGHGTEAGLIQGKCCPHDSHGGMMCVNPEHAADACPDEEGTTSGVPACSNGLLQYIMAIALSSVVLWHAGQMR